MFELTINEYKEEARKLFVFMSDSDVYFGWCEHF